MLDLLTATVDAAAGHCDYAEARHVATRHEHLATRNGALDAIHDEQSEGIGVRVRVQGRWGFSATSDCSAQSAQRALAQAIAIAERQPRATGTAPLVPAEPARGTWSGPFEVDPFQVSIEDKLELLLAADAALHSDPRVVQSTAACHSLRVDSALATSDGVAIRQARVECGGGIRAIAVDGDELQQRGHPGGHDGNAALGGWEVVLALDLAGEAPRVADEALALLAAPDCPAGKRTVILGSDQLALQIHESVGHALELDRILGAEASYAGTSWVGVGDFGALRYGSNLMNVTADATLPGGLGTFGWDDEGTPAQRLALVEGGVLRDALSSRETAPAIGRASSGGCMRAEGFARQPIVRMTNVSLEPGDSGSLADLIAATDDGLYLETNRSWSIDDRRLNFQFGVELAREISGGKLGKLYRNAVYTGVTPQFWAGMDAVGGSQDWRAWGVLNCGKGEPGQVMRVSHGAPPARFVDVDVWAG